MHAVLSILLSFILLSTACTSVEQSGQTGNDAVETAIVPIPELVLDGADLLSNKEKKRLITQLTAYQDSGDITLALITVPSLAGKSIFEAGIEQFNQYQIGEKGINNGAAIFIAKEDRAFRILTGYGLEWQIPDTVSGQIITEMQPFFKEGEFYEGCQRGFEALFTLGRTVSWGVRYQNMVELRTYQDDAKGNIVRFKGKGMPRNYDGGDDSKQFNAERFVNVFPVEGGQPVRVNFSAYMAEMADRIVYADDPMTLYARVLNTQPLELNLLGVE
jgi:hypothetical protein